MTTSGADKLMRRAIALAREGRADQAERLLAQVCARDERNGAAWFMRGAIRYQSGDADGAIEFLRGAVERDPRHGEAWLALGSIQVDAGRFGEAERASRVAIELLPGANEPRINLVNALLSQGKRDEALAWCDKVRADATAHPGILHSLGLAFKALDSIDDAEQCLARAARADPGNAAALCALADIKAARDQVDEALALYRRSRDLDPADPRVHFQMGKLLLPASSARHRQWVADLQRDHRYRDAEEARVIAARLAGGLRSGDAVAEHALARFFGDYDPDRLYPAEWWRDALARFGDRRRAPDTALRSVYAAVFSWSLPCRQALEAIAAFAGRRLASYGSGAGYWEYLLATRYGLEVTCHDVMLRHRFTAMEKLDHADVTLDPEDTIFLAWLPGDGAIDAAIESLLDQAAPGQKLVLVGEPADRYGQPRTCATRRFFRYLGDNFAASGILPLANYAYFHDRVELLEKK